MKTYRITIEGHLDQQWSEWFDGVQISLQKNGTTHIIYPHADQAALYGMLKKIYNLGIPLLSIDQVASSENNQTTNEP